MWTFLHLYGVNVVIAVNKFHYNENARVERKSKDTRTSIFGKSAHLRVVWTAIESDTQTERRRWGRAGHTVYRVISA